MISLVNLTLLSFSK
uniref:Uncharacterized protein n=1 Tax=Rhizophora mucronata TaxID=61149 RepID=A0A2P2NG29_RHIMU